MPLTSFQRELLSLLSADRDDVSYLAGGAAIHFAPNSQRYSDDLDFFHDSLERVARAFERDAACLRENGFTVSLDFSQPGFIRALVTRGQHATRVDWAHDSAWRFMPLVRDELAGLLLHPVDLAINKVLALAGRDEARDYIDILFVHRTVLPLGGLVWATAGKDPGLSPGALLELLKRRGHSRPEEFARLALVAPFDVSAARETWHQALEEAEAFVRTRMPTELGCLYYSPEAGNFVVPRVTDAPGSYVMHFGAPGGVLPQIVN